MFQERILTKLCTEGDIGNVIIGINFRIHKLRSFGIWDVQILASATDMAGHPSTEQKCTLPKLMICSLRLLGGRQKAIQPAKL